MKVIGVKVADIKLSEFSMGIYNPEPSPEFVDSVRKNGVLEKPVVDQDINLISGHKRVKACLLAGIKEIEVEVREVDSREGFERLVIEYNRYREPTWKQKLAEATWWEAKLKPIAEERKRAGVRKNYAEGGPIRVREEVAKQIGWSHDKLHRVRYIAEHKAELLDAWDRGEESVNSAWRKLKQSHPELFYKRERERADFLKPGGSFRLLYVLGWALGCHTDFPFKLTPGGPAYNSFLQGLRDGFRKTEPVVQIDEGWEEAVKRCPLLKGKNPASNRSSGPT